MHTHTHTYKLNCVYLLSVCVEIQILSRDEVLLQLTRERSCWNDHRGDMSEAYHGGRLRCYVHIMDEGMCYRVNTLAAYIEANRLVSERVKLDVLNVYSSVSDCFMASMLISYTAFFTCHIKLIAGSVSNPNLQLLDVINMTFYLVRNMLPVHYWHYCFILFNEHVCYNVLCSRPLSCLMSLQSIHQQWSLSAVW